MKKILIAILMFCCVPMFARGDEPEILNKTVPFSRLYKAVQNYNALYDSDFVFFLENQISDGEYTLGNLAQACANYTKFNNDVTIDVCRNFMTDVIHGVTTPSASDYPFIVTTTSDTKKFEFMISAAGDFTVDCGNGEVRAIKKMNTDEQTITCNYDNADAHTIKIGGKAKAYSFVTAAISFAENKYLGGISGSLGAIFPTLDGDSQPTFDSTFYGCTGLNGTIPADLFKGIKGKPAYSMFYKTFHGCSGLTGSIPANLFEGIKGKPAKWMFADTFSGCTGLNDTIPADLFAGIEGNPAEWMFHGTFEGCSRLNGTIPADLFKGIKGPPAKWMFYETFNGCSGLSGEIPKKLFAGIKGPPADWMFYRTFHGCSGLNGTIPADLFAGIKGPQAKWMFYSTFDGCSKLSGEVGPDFFGTINPLIDDGYVKNQFIFDGTKVTFDN